MNAPHYSTNPAAVATFERLGRNPAVAVRAVLSLGFSLTKEDLEVPHIVELARLDRASRSDYAMRFATELANERAALALLENQDRIRASLTAPSAKRDAHAATMQARVAAGQATPAALDAARDAWTRNRVAELEAEHWRALRESWTAQAQREAGEIFDGRAPAAPTSEPAPAPRKSRKAA